MVAILTLFCSYFGMRKLLAGVLASQLLMMVPPLPSIWANEAGALLPANSLDDVQSGTGGLQFDGLSNYVTFGPATDTLGASQFTLEVWFKRTGTGKFANTGTGGLIAVPLVTKGRGETDGDNRDMNYFLGIDSSGVLAADFEEGPGGAGPLGLNHPVLGHTIIGTGVWYHAAVTYDGTNWALYLNGNVETNLFVGQPPRADSIQHAALGSALNSSGIPQGFFQGILDEARIWSYARSADQIAATMNQQIGSVSGLIGRWGLNDGSGQTAGNSVAGGPDGTLMNGPMWCLGYAFPTDIKLAPNVSITSPLDGDTITATTYVTVTVEADDIDGTVTSVTFWDGATLCGILTNRPFSLMWSNVVVGDHELSVVATDDSGLSTTSDVVNVSVVLTNYSPVLESLNSPAADATNVSLSPILSATASDPESNAVTVTFYGRLIPITPDFTIVALPDTQYYSKTYPNIFQSQIDWIINNRTKLNIVYVASLGDITDDGDCSQSEYEWMNATNALYRLEDPLLTGLPDGIPYGVVPGNHDHNCGTRFYNKYFSVNHFFGHGYYGGNLGTDNQNHYDLISAGGMDFVIVHMDFDYAYSDVNYPAIDAWANSVLQANAERRAIVVSHCILRGDGTYDDSRNPSVYSSLKANPNLFLMLCGHNVREAWRQDTYQGRTVTTCLSDYQFDANGGNGLLRLYEFSPTNSLIHVRTYSPYLDQYELDDDSDFEFGYQMDDPNSYFVIGSTTVPSGARASLTWSGLAPGTHYQWYVTVSDGTNTITSATQHFTTTTEGTNTPPTVIITAPSNGTAVMEGTDLVLQASVSDVENFITEVDFVINGTNLGAATSNYSLVWSNVVSGDYSLLAVAFDSAGLSSTSTPVTLIVESIADAPVANSQTTNTEAEESLPLILSGSDLNGDALTYVITVRPAHGFLSDFDPQSGTVIYQPSHAFAGTDSFQFVVCDGLFTSHAATVTVAVTALADNNNNGLPDAWETAQGITDPNADDDHDGLTNWQEYEAGTDPHDPTSYFAISGADCNPSGCFTITWLSVGGVRYRVCYSDGDSHGRFTGEFTDIVRPAESEIDPAPAGTPSSQTFADDFTLTGGPPAQGARYFRVKIVQ